MKFGIVTPVVTLAPHSHAPWEREAGPAEIATIARTADDLGYDFLTCSEHIGVPQSAVAERGARYYDPAATLGYIAAITERIDLLTYVLVLPYHHPLTVAKRYGTIDRLSGGRLLLGVGVGSLEEEFDLVDAGFDDRGPRFEDALKAVRAAMGRTDPKYSGSHYQFSGFTIDPTSLQAQPPIWLGGRTARSLRRALAFGDGWAPFSLTADELRTMIDRARKTSEWADRHEQDAPFDIALKPEQPLQLDTADQVEVVRSTVRTYREIGATALSLRFRHDSLAHYCELINRFAVEVAPEFIQSLD